MLSEHKEHLFPSNSVRRLDARSGHVIAVWSNLCSSLSSFQRGLETRDTRAVVCRDL